MNRVDGYINWYSIGMDHIVDGQAQSTVTLTHKDWKLENRYLHYHEDQMGRRLLRKHSKLHNCKEMIISVNSFRASYAMSYRI